MKRKHFIYVLGFVFASISLEVYAEHANLFPTLAGLSRTQRTEFFDSDMPNLTYAVQALGEVTIQGKQYLQFEESGMYLREADGKVYLYSGKGDEDLVLYDYTLKVGDVLRTIEWEDDSFTTFSYGLTGMTVVKVEPITLLDGQEYKKWTFDNGVEYVETIGSYGNGVWAGDFFRLAPQVIPVSLVNVYCVCISRNGQLLYEMPAEEQKRLNTHCMSIDDPETAVQNVTATQYDYQDGVISVQVPNAQMRLYDMQGRCLQQTMQPSMDVSTLSGGIYVLHIAQPNGESKVLKIATR